MTIDDLIKQLNDIKAKHGNLPVKVQTLSHTWDPDLVLRPLTKPNQPEYLLLNG